MFGPVSRGPRPSFPRKRGSSHIAALAILAAVFACAGCADRAPPRAQVEALFDVPREYRILSTLPCAEGAALAYVVSAQGDLYSFEPDTLEFRRIGALHCPAHFG